MSKDREIADALRACLISPNVPDSNLEPANPVDVIAGAGHNIANALKRISDAIIELAEAVDRSSASKR